MPRRTKAPGEYSTNPNTVKARRRKMNMTDAQKVEDAAKLADYKAMVHARQVVQLKPDFARASESEKSTMLEKAMRETMEKRREKGRDTMSKMAAFRAGDYRAIGGVLGIHTRVPIADFLKKNGFVPARTPKPRQRGATADGNNTNHADQGPHTYMPVGLESMDDMEEVDSAFTTGNGIRTSAGEQSFSPNYHLASAPAHQTRRNINLLDSQSPPSAHLHGVKVSPGSFSNMSPERMISSIEGDVPMNDVDDSSSNLQTEMGHMRTICENVAANNKHTRFELGKIEAEMGMEKSRMQDLEVKINQLEGVVHALQNTSLGNIVDRVNDLEIVVEQLKVKVGSGCDAEIAKMREVMGGLKNLMDNVGSFV